jgi:uncharacterized membrane protein YcaP (DUF421 family)
MTMADWFGASWDTVGFVAASTLAMYVTLLVAIRIAGRRTVTQLSAFDVIVTVALGTLLSSTVVSAEPSYAQATTAIATLLVLQVLVAAVRRRSQVAQRLLEFEPEVVVRDGELHLPTGLLTSQLSEGELRSRLRQHGIFDDEPLAVVVLEPSGRISVSRRLDRDAAALLPGGATPE